MTHGRAQRHTITIGGSTDGDVHGLPAGGHPGLWRLPEDRRDPAVPDDPDGLRPVRHPETPRPSRPRSPPAPRRSAPTGAPAAQRPQLPWSGRSTCSPPRSGWIPPRSGGATCCRRSPSRTRPRSARCTTAATTWPRWTRRSRPPVTPTCAPSRPGGARAATSPSSASAWPATWRSPAAATSRARRQRTPPSRCTRTGPRRSSPAPRRTARATLRPGR